jgi:hypothetical protein
MDLVLVWLAEDEDVDVTYRPLAGYEDLALLLGAQDGQERWAGCLSTIRRLFNLRLARLAYSASPADDHCACSLRQPAGSPKLNGIGLAVSLRSEACRATSL